MVICFGVIRTNIGGGIKIFPGEKTLPFIVEGKLLTCYELGRKWHLRKRCNLNIPSHDIIEEVNKIESIAGDEENQQDEEKNMEEEEGQHAK